MWLLRGSWRLASKIQSLRIVGYAALGYAAVAVQCTRPSSRTCRPWSRAAQAQVSLEPSMAVTKICARLPSVKPLVRPA